MSNRKRELNDIIIAYNCSYYNYYYAVIITIQFHFLIIIA
jgi:hypothetical protein